MDHDAPVRNGWPVTAEGTQDQSGFSPSVPGCQPFVITTPGEIRFGWGEAQRLPEETARFGRRPLVVAGSALRRSGRLDAIMADLIAASLEPAMLDGVPPEPTLEMLQQAMDACASARADMVVSIGGGSVLDIGKAAA